MLKSTKGPFKRDGRQVYVMAQSDRYCFAEVTGLSDPDSPDYAPIDRMIACANACEGIDPKAVPELLAYAKCVIEKGLTNEVKMRLQAAIKKAVGGAS